MLVEIAITGETHLNNFDKANEKLTYHQDTVPIRGLIHLKFFPAAGDKDGFTRCFRLPVHALQKKM